MNTQSSYIIHKSDSKFSYSDDFKNLIKQKAKLTFDLNHTFKATHEQSLTRYLMIESKLFIKTNINPKPKLLLIQTQEFKVYNLNNNEDSHQCVEQAAYISLDELLVVLKEKMPIIYKEGELSLLDTDLLFSDISGFLSILF